MGVTGNNITPRDGCPHPEYGEDCCRETPCRGWPAPVSQAMNRRMREWMDRTGGTAIAAKYREALQKVYGKKHVNK